MRLELRDVALREIGALLGRGPFTVLAAASGELSAGRGQRPRLAAARASATVRTAVVPVRPSQRPAVPALMLPPAVALASASAGGSASAPPASAAAPRGCSGGALVAGCGCRPPAGICACGGSRACDASQKLLRRNNLGHDRILGRRYGGSGRGSAMGPHQDMGEQPRWSARCARNLPSPRYEMGKGVSSRNSADNMLSSRPSDVFYWGVAVLLRSNRQGDVAAHAARRTSSASAR